MINYIIYGNTDYLDVLEIQTDYMYNRGHLTLFINRNELYLTDLYNKYNEVIFYDEKDSYATRLLTCLEQVNYDYVLLIHDIDILLDVDYDMMVKFKDYLKTNDFDRIDLKHTDKVNSDSILIDVETWSKISFNNLKDGIYLVEQTDPNDFIYNVNPSIWKRESFINLLSNFKYKNYRSIEEMDVQMFSTKFKVFKMFSKEKVLCGYFNCLDIFKFLHISHSGKFLPLNPEFKTVYGQPYTDIKDEYIKIVEKYNLTAKNKWIN